MVIFRSGFMDHQEASGFFVTGAREAEELGAAIGRLGVEVGGGTILDELDDSFAEFSHLLGNHEPEPDIPKNNGPPEEVQTGGSPCHFVGRGQRYRLLLKEDTILGPSQSRFVKMRPTDLIVAV